MKKPFKLKYKSSAFPFKKDEKEIGDTLVEPKQGNTNVPPISQEVLDIYGKLDWSDKANINVEDFQKAYFEQQKGERNWRNTDNRLERKRMDRDDLYPDPNELG